MEFGAALKLKDGMTTPLKKATNSFMTFKRSLTTCNTALKKVNRSVATATVTTTELGAGGTVAGAGLTEVGVGATAATAGVSKMKNALAPLMMGLTGVIAIFKSVQMAGHFEEMQNKFDVSFGAMTESAENWSKKMSKNWNKSVIDIKGAMANTQDMLTGFGLGGKEAAAFSKKIVALGTDLSSFHDIKASEGIDRLTKALMGQMIAGKRVGLAMTQEALMQEARDEGITKSYAHLSIMEKMTLRMNLAVKQSPNALGDAVRTQHMWQNTLRGGIAVVRDIATSIGGLITGALKPLVSVLSGALSQFKFSFDTAKKSGTAFGGLVLTLVRVYVAYKLVTTAVKLYTWWTELSIFKTKLYMATLKILRGVIWLTAGVFNAMKWAVVQYSIGSGGATTATAILSGAMSLLNGIMALNPFVLVGAALAGLAVGIIYAYKHFTWFGTAVKKVWSILKYVPFIWVIVKLFKLIGTIGAWAFKHIQNSGFMKFLRTLGRIVKSVGRAFKSFFTMGGEDDDKTIKSINKKAEAQKNYLKMATKLPSGEVSMQSQGIQNMQSGGGGTSSNSSSNKKIFRGSRVTQSFTYNTTNTVTNNNNIKNKNAIKKQHALQELVNTFMAKTNDSFKYNKIDELRNNNNKIFGKYNLNSDIPQNWAKTSDMDISKKTGDIIIKIENNNLHVKSAEDINRIAEEIAKATKEKLGGLQYAI